jgi:hypothetical protein
VISTHALASSVGPAGSAVSAGVVSWAVAEVVSLVGVVEPFGPVAELGAVGLLLEHPEASTAVATTAVSSTRPGTRPAENGCRI